MEALMNMVPEVLALVLSIFFIISFHLLGLSKSRTSVRPQEPTGRLPLIGHLGILPTSTPLHTVLGSLSDRYGPIFTLSLGQRLAVVITSSELAKECFTTNDRSLATRPVLYSSKILGYDRRMLGLAPYGTHWRDMRKLSTTELLSSQRIELLKHVRIQEVDSLVKGLYKECCRDSTGLIGVEMKRRLGFLTMNIVLRMVVGKRFFATDGEEMNEEGREFHELIEEFFYLLGGLTVSDALPWLAWLDVDGKLKAMRRVYKKMDDVAQAWVLEHRHKLLMRKEEGDLQVESSKDFIDVMISLLMEGDHGLMDGQDHSSDVLIKSSALGMITAASDTTSNGLIWVLSLLLNNRDVLKKAQLELDYHVGKERNVEESDLTKLSYLHAVVKETLRLYPIGPLLVPHEASEPVESEDFISQKELCYS